jgi:hypothetical protein
MAWRKRCSDEPRLRQFLLQRKVALGMIVVLLAIGVLLASSRAATSAIVPDLLGERVDPQLDALRLRLAADGFVLDEVSIAPCPGLDIPGASLEQVPGTIVGQHPAPGERVASPGAVDVTVCLPD